MARLISERVRRMTMENLVEKQPWAMPFGFHVGFFLFFLLLSLDNLWSVWVAANGHGWNLKFEIILPWLFCSLMGGLLYTGSKHGDIERRTAGPLLMFLGFIVMSAYTAMYKLGSIGH